MKTKITVAMACFIGFVLCSAAVAYYPMPIVRECPYYAPRPVYVEHHYRPVVVERHYYQEPVYYAAPAPSGFFFGMSVVEPGVAFSFGVGGR